MPEPNPGFRLHRAAPSSPLPPPPPESPISNNNITDAKPIRSLNIKAFIASNKPTTTSTINNATESRPSQSQSQPQSKSPSTNLSKKAQSEINLSKLSSPRSIRIPVARQKILNDPHSRGNNRIKIKNSNVGSTQSSVVWGNDNVPRVPEDVSRRLTSTTANSNSSNNVSVAEEYVEEKPGWDEDFVEFESLKLGHVESVHEMEYRRELKGQEKSIANMSLAMRIRREGKGGGVKKDEQKKQKQQQQQAPSGKQPVSLMDLMSSQQSSTPKKKKQGTTMSLMELMMSKEKGKEEEKEKNTDADGQAALWAKFGM